MIVRKSGPGELRGVVGSSGRGSKAARRGVLESLVACRLGLSVSGVKSVFDRCLLRKEKSKPIKQPNNGSLFTRIFFSSQDFSAMTNELCAI
jgi:hypothetical protein